MPWRIAVLANPPIPSIGELLNRRPWKPYVLLAGLCGLVTIANPYGYHYWTYLLQAATMPRPYITEWQPVNLFGHRSSDSVLL